MIPFGTKVDGDEVISAGVCGAEEFVEVSGVSGGPGVVEIGDGIGLY